jgi:3'-phosphoadenosine 5'-phosphosulfate sulfotransferase
MGLATNMKLKERRRTIPQNKSLHKYCTDVADTLNASGISMSVFFTDLEADYTMEIIKNLFRKFAKVKYGKTSTKDLNTNEVTAIYDEVNRHLAKFGLHIEWPSQETLNQKYDT